MQREELQQKFARSQKLFGEIHFLRENLAQSERLLRTQAKTEVEIDFLKRRIDAAKQLLATKTTEWTEINRQLTNAQSSSLPAVGEEPRRNNSGNAGTTRRWRCEGGICGWFSGSGKKANTPAGTRGGNRKKLSKLRKTRSKKLKKN
jgi:hypothetical protein